MSRTLALAVLSLFTLHAAAHAGWRTQTQRDSMTDGQIVFAVADAGPAQLLIYENEGRFAGALRMVKPRQYIHYEPKRIGLRVDRNPAIFLETYSWEPLTTFFDVPVEVIDQMRAGTLLRVAYPVSRNYSQELVVPLSGSGGVLKKALASYKDPATREKDARLAEATQAREAEARRAAQEHARLHVTPEQQAANARSLADEPPDMREVSGQRALECPGAWRRYKDVEERYGPQPWQGCDGAY